MLDNVDKSFLLIALSGILTLAGGVRALLLVQGASDWNDLNHALLFGTLAFIAAGFFHANAAIGLRNGVLMFALVACVSLAAECFGTRYPYLFGDTYHYHESLQPGLCDIPLVVPLAWVGLAYSPVAYLRCFPTRLLGKLAPGRLLAKAVLCAVFLVNVDLLIEPLAIAVKIWTWDSPGAYYGAPPLNLIGWFVVATPVYALYFIMESPRVDRCGRVGVLADSSYIACTLGLTVLAGLASFTKNIGLLPVLWSSSAIAGFTIHWWCQRAWR